MSGRAGPGRSATFTGWWGGPIDPAPTAGALVTTDPNRWNRAGERTAYLALDLPLALVEHGRHRPMAGAEPTGFWTMTVGPLTALDLRHPKVRRTLGLVEPCWFLHRGRTRAVAARVRRSGSVEALLVPSAGMMGGRSGANLVILLDPDRVPPVRDLRLACRLSNA
jgi:hypothetical protein